MKRFITILSIFVMVFVFMGCKETATTTTQTPIQTTTTPVATTLTSNTETTAFVETTEDIEEITVSFELNGGIPLIESQFIQTGDTISRPADPEKNGFRFVGWHVNGEPFDFGQTIVSETTLVAVWQQEFELPNGDLTKVYFDNYDQEKAIISVYASHLPEGDKLNQNSDGTYTMAPGVYCYTLRNIDDAYYYEYNKVYLMTEEKIQASKADGNAIFVDAFEGLRKNNGTEDRDPINLLNDEITANNGVKGTGSLTSYDLIDRYETPALKRLAEGKTHQYTTIEEIGEFLSDILAGDFEYNKYMNVYIAGYSEKNHFPIYAVLFTTVNVDGLDYHEALELASEDAIANQKAKIMHMATVHGSEHTPSEGELAIIYQLAKGTYTDGVTSNIETMEELFSRASFVILPRFNVDGAYEVQRYQQYRYIDSNRDSLMLQNPENLAMVKTYYSFMADLVIDGHELNGDKFYDNGFGRIEVQPGVKNANTIGPELAMYTISQLFPYALQVLSSENIIANPYATIPGALPGGQHYSLTGALNMLVEVRGTAIGMDYYPRRVYSYLTCVKALSDKVIMDAREFEYDEELARRNLIASEEADGWFDLSTSDSSLNMIQRRRELLMSGKEILVIESAQSGYIRYGDTLDPYGIGTHGRFYYDGTIGTTDNIRTMRYHDTFVETRELPEGYFIEKETFLGRSNIGYHHTTLQEIFDNHGIEYYYMTNLDNPLVVQQIKAVSFDTFPRKMAATNEYKTSIPIVSSVTEEEVLTNFADGVFYVPMNQLRSLVAAYLLEQDIVDNSLDDGSLSNNIRVAMQSTLYGAGYLSLDDNNRLPIYRYYADQNNNADLSLIKSTVVKKIMDEYYPLDKPITLAQLGDLDLSTLYLKTQTRNLSYVEYTQLSTEMLSGYDSSVLGNQTARVTDNQDPNHFATFAIRVYSETEAANEIVYVRSDGNDTNDGLSDQAAVRTILRAYEILAEMNSDGHGAIIICNSVGYSEINDVIPKHTGLVTITSAFETNQGTIDYQTGGAELVLFQNMLLNGPTVFKNINIRNGVPHTSRSICAQGNNLAIDESVTTITTLGYYPSIIGGNENGILQSNTYIVVKSGYWRNLTGGSYRGITEGNVQVSIYGGTFENMFYGGVYHSDEGLEIPSGFVEGNITIEIHNGHFICGVYGGSNYGDVWGNTTVIINGGVFEKSITASSNRGEVTGATILVDNRQ